MPLNEKDIRIIVEDVVNEIINRRELNEILSVAEPVDTEADRVLDLIENNYKKFGQKKEKEGYSEYEGILTDIIFGTECQIQFYVREFKDKNSYL